MRRILSLVLLLSFVTVCSEAAPDRDSIRKAIDRGAKYLKDPIQLKNYQNQRPGYMAVVGLALLESDIPPSDPALVQITEAIREQCLLKIETYDIALAIMYLDRLGEAADIPLIQYLGVRLMAGQNSAGMWTYTWGAQPTPEEAARIRKILVPETELKSRDPKGALPQAETTKKTPPKKIVPVTVDPNEGKNTETVEKPAEKAARLHPEVKKIMDRIEAERRARPLGGGDFEFGGGDLSNTQFAIIGLWCARKHGVPVDGILLRAEDYFRKSQNLDGGWSYTRTGPSSAAMTCPGLISLAMGFGLKKPVKGKEKEFDPNNDAWMKRGMIRLGSYLAGAPQQGNSESLNQNYYFLWSLERTGVIYGIDTINDVDWFGWGSTFLLKQQGENGSWSGGSYHGATTDLDTAFAVLFLNRANLAKDLTANLKGRVKDPGSTTLKGGKDLQSLIPELASKTPPPETSTPTRTPEMRPNTSPAISGPTTNPTIPSPVPVDRGVPNDPYEKEVRELSDSLVSANSSTRKEILTKLRDTKGGVYTDALSRAIRRLEGEPLKEARDALSSRLSRMTANTLKQMMKDENREIRRAAALACVMKDDRNLIPDLIDCLADLDPVVNRAAKSALKSLTGKDFGPEPDAPPGEVAKAVAAWKAWWITQK